MGWDNPPVPWRELERRLSWGTKPAKGADADEDGRGEPTGDNAANAAEARQLPPVAYLQAGHDRDHHGPASRRRKHRQLAWAELHCHSSYSFLDGASSPDELVTEAAERGLTALAITDHDGMYGVPQFAQAAARLRDSGGTLGTVFGAELGLDLGAAQSPRPRPARTSRAGAGSRGTPRAGVPDPAGRHLLVLARDPEGYARLCRVISEAQLAGGEKGRPVYDEAALADSHDGHWVILTGCRKGAVPAALAADIQALAAADPALAAAADPASAHRPPSRVPRATSTPSVSDRAARYRAAGASCAR